MREGKSATYTVVSQKPTRRYELDWLRTLVVMGLIPVHTAIIFAPTTDFYIKDAHTSEAAVVFGAFVGVFGMPVLFFVAGAAAWFALKSRSSGRFARERILRLFVPLIFASLAISPIQAYVVTLSNPSFAAAIGAPIVDPHYLDSFPQFYVQYLRDYVYFLGHPSIAGFLAFVGQLWFVLYLLVFSLLALPLFEYLKSSRGSQVVKRLAAFCDQPMAIFALAAPLALVDGVAHALWTGTGAVAEILVYLVCFVYGYMMYADDRIVAAMRRQWAPAIAAGLGLWLIAEIWLIQRPPQPYDNAMGSMFFIPLRGVIAWFWVVGLIGAFSLYVNRTSRLLRYLSEAAYPIYILHVAAIVSVGYVVVRWDISPLAKFGVIMIAAYVIVIGTYEALIKRVRVLRTLFGLRNEPQPHARTPSRRRWWLASPDRGATSHVTSWRLSNLAP
ncbi:MAG TPA: acyltransferase family protein [Ktedonobacterales bacterium]|jgi:peptidoglycan/LPS O-acetylase OafA/YrhL|nr:acyltransferase family protein [Ktedonobacterales bacterium]